MKDCSKILGENVLVIQGVKIGKRQTMCVLVEVAVAPLGEVYHCRGGFEVSFA